MKRKNHQEWSWILMVLFIMLSILDIRFGLLGLICMTVPLYHALRGRGKVHCSHYCPRGSLLGKFLTHINLNNNLPKSLRGKTAKKVMLGIMMIMFSISLSHAGFNITKIAFAIFRLMTASLTLGIIMGIIFKPRSWCQVCPMGYASELITNSLKNKNTQQRVRTEP
ncbi:4Fe-4S binding protein [Petroclostridium sp. X23]|uniref:4Fe-4S binding protein n=1 Tax=Petroclostridium sp. X23 TaxID=3045146 RepID=UPI0024ADA8F0|nr:4Fe-4S binding protein [Petroclostridium sp. X23]WHH60847.1 4Fe-4S binding protein [Petroclostridium sp. X23]